MIVVVIGWARFNSRGWVVSPKDAPSTRVVGVDFREHLSMLGCISMTGAVMMPLFMIKGRSEAKYDQFVPVMKNYSIVSTDNAWMNSHVWLEWLKTIFIPCSGATKDNRVLLLIDNHSTHLTFDAIQFASDNGVDIFPFPPRASHIMQPLDVGVFGALKSLVEQEWMDAMINSFTLDIMLLIEIVMRPRVFPVAFGGPCVVRGWMESGKSHSPNDCCDDMVIVKYK